MKRFYKHDASIGEEERKKKYVHCIPYPDENRIMIWKGEIPVGKVEEKDGEPTVSINTYGHPLIELKVSDLDIIAEQWGIMKYMRHYKETYNPFFGQLSLFRD